MIRSIRQTLITAITAAVLTSATFGMQSALADGDAEAGKKAFRRCAACHTVDEGKNRVGPSLYGVMGRTAGTLEGFKFSPAMVEYGAVWDDATLDAFLADPRGTVGRTRMSLPGLKKEADRANIIAYLNSVSE